MVGTESRQLEYFPKRVRVARPQSMQQTNQNYASNGQPRASQGDSEASPVLPKIVPFGDLSRCGEEVWISHNGQLYRLRATKQGKLILTK